MFFLLVFFFVCAYENKIRRRRNVDGHMKTMCNIHRYLPAFNYSIVNPFQSIPIIERNYDQSEHGRDK
jgi:hypothetical protein